MGKKRTIYEVEDEEPEYEVEEIRGSRTKGGKKEYQIKWKGYNEVTWEPVKNLTHCKESLADFERKKRTEGPVSDNVPLQPKKIKTNSDLMNLFWAFIFARQKIRDCKQAGTKVEDELAKLEILKTETLLKYHFCNNYRELDAGTIYFQEQVKKEEEKSGKKLDTKTLIRMTIVYRLVNKMSTFTAFGGIPTTPEKCQEFKKFLQKRRNLGITSFTNAHQTGGFDKYYESLNDIENALPTLAKNCANMESFFNSVTTEISNVGNFFGQQLTCDLMESGVIGGSENDWVKLGPGAITGLQILFPGVKTQDELVDKAKWLWKNQKSQFAKYDLDFPFWEGKELSLKNIEHALCEFQKYYYFAIKGGNLRLYTPSKKT